MIPEKDNLQTQWLDISKHELSQFEIDEEDDYRILTSLTETAWAWQQRDKSKTVVLINLNEKLQEGKRVVKGYY